MAEPPPAKRARTEPYEPMLPLDVMAREIPQHFVHLDDVVQFASLCWALRRQVPLTHLLELLYVRVMRSPLSGMSYDPALRVLEVCYARASLSAYDKIRQAWTLMATIFRETITKINPEWGAKTKLDLLCGTPPVPRAIPSRIQQKNRVWLANELRVDDFHVRSGTYSFDENGVKWMLEYDLHTDGMLLVAFDPSMWWNNYGTMSAATSGHTATPVFSFLLAMISTTLKDRTRFLDKYSKYTRIDLCPVLYTFVS